MQFYADESQPQYVQLHEKVYIDFRINELSISNETETASWRVDIPGEYCPSRSDEPATP
jgi:hypothetical protein